MKFKRLKKQAKKIIEHEKTQLILANKKFQRFEKWFLLIIWASGIYYLSSQPLEFLAAFDQWTWLIRKFAHIFEFGVLTFLIFRILKYTEKRHIYWDLFWAFAFAILYAISDEYHQTFVPGRVGNYKDVLIDSIGGIIAVWLLYLRYHHERIRQLKYKKQAIKEEPL